MTKTLAFEGWRYLAGGASINAKHIPGSRNSGRRKRIGNIMESLEVLLHFSSEGWAVVHILHLPGLLF
jgi:hypothetical protein